MPSFDVDEEEITAFRIEEIILFKEYFDQDELFDKLDKYYNYDKYRFEIPEDEINEVRQILEEFFYELEIVDNFEDYCVVSQENSDFRGILRNSVMRTERNNKEVFLMKDELSVRQAEEMDAIPLAKSKISPGDLGW